MRTLLFFLFFLATSSILAQADFSHTLKSEVLPWTSKQFDNNPEHFQFAIVSDRTGGHRAGVFGDALGKLNLLHPEFVMSVGDLIEGYSDDTTILNAQWSEFDSILSTLNMKFFALPGNHDISNGVMRREWIDRYGSSYYHFLYKDVLFLAFDTNDGDGVVLSDQQINYFTKVIDEHPNVRWTMLFMHHPIWNYRSFSGFQQIEDALSGRSYTVFAGHTHRYFKSERQGQKYYVLSTTGGGSQLRGPRVGEFDHVSWVTMTPEGPDVVHLELKGIIKEDVLGDETASIALALNNASKIDRLILMSDSNEAIAYFKISNSVESNESVESSGLFYEEQEETGKFSPGKSLRFIGKFYHNHHITPSKSELSFIVPPDSSVQFAIPMSIQKGKMDSVASDPLELDWVLAFESVPFEPSFQLSGIASVEPVAQATGLQMTPMDIFFDSHLVELSSSFEEVEIRYTLDGSDPDFGDSRYSGPISIDSTVHIKARYFSSDGQFKSEIVERTYKKVKPLAAQRLRKGKLVPGLTYSYFEGDFEDQLPDFSKLSPLRTGVALFSHPDSLEHRLDHFAITYEGYIEIPEDGIYTFYTSSDDGSQLFIHDLLVVDNDGSHSTRTREGNIALSKGFHPILVTYFEDFLGESLEIGFKSNRIPRQRIPFSTLFHAR